MDNKTYTYQARLSSMSIQQSDCLQDMANIFNKIERQLFSEYSQGVNLLKEKSRYLSEYGITARHFNAIRIYLQGKIASIKILSNDYITNTKTKIKKTAASIKYLNNLKSKTNKQLNKLHQKQRLLKRTKNKLKRLEQDKKQNKVRICFGSKRLFNQQFNLEKNGYANHNEWLQDWKFKRNNQFTLIGSKDETMGNQSCIATLNDDGTINLRVRVPDILSEKYGKFITINNVTLNYGKDEIIKALQNNIKRNYLNKKANRNLYGDLFKQHGIAINYRFFLDSKGWRIFITLEQKAKSSITIENIGAIGIDINEDHLAITETNRSGNPIKSFNIPVCTYGKDKNQAKAIIGDAAAKIISFAILTKKPIVIEDLNFTDKKRNLANMSKKRARMLSGFSYATIIQFLESRAFRYGITIKKVNPAYSSIIGRVKFARIYKLSVHQAAALVIARRYQNFSERMPRYWDKIPDNKGGHLTLPRLVKIEGRHVWHTWAKVLKNLKMVLAAQYQMLRQVELQKLVLPDKSETLVDDLVF